LWLAPSPQVIETSFDAGRHPGRYWHRNHGAVAAGRQGPRPASVSLTRPTKRRAFHSALDDAGGFVMPWRANVVNDPARDQRQTGSLVCWAAPLLLHDDRRADLDPVIEIDHILIGQANAAR